jgi:hypothetical protein
LYISQIQLTDIRPFKTLSFGLHSQDEGPLSWGLILGDNGTGKTTLLRSIAMGLCDAASASALLKDIPGETIREGANAATIRVELAQSWSSPEPRLSIETTLTKGQGGNVEVSQKTSPEAFPWDKIFVCGYGAGRSVYGIEDYEKYSTVDAVYSLFSYDIALQNPELALYRLNRFSNIEIDDILQQIDRILMLPAGSTRLTKTGISISGPWGSFKPSGAVGDGYKATLSLIADLFGWWSMFQKDDIINTDLQGIILIDELEQHLHPRWQQSIIRLLHARFPKMQFLVTTHSPICAIGTAALKDSECELILLRQVGECVQGVANLKPPRRQRADQVLTSYLFGLEGTRSDDLARDINRYSSLKGRQELTQDEQAEFSELQARLNKVLGSGETDLQRQVEMAVRETFDKLAQDLKAPTLDPVAVDFEIRRQLRELFDFGEQS